MTVYKEKNVASSFCAVSLFTEIKGNAEIQRKIQGQLEVRPSYLPRRNKLLLHRFI